MTLAALATVAALISWILFRLMIDISASYPSDNIHKHRADQRADTVNIGVVSRFPANILYQGYQPLLDYLIEETPYHFELVISPSYSDAVMLLADGSIHAAFLGSYIYFISQEDFNLVPVLKPLNEDGKPFFHSVVIVKEDSDIHDLESLYGRNLALPSDLSYSGNWLTAYGWVDESRLSRKTHFSNHHIVVYEVMRGNYDAGSVKDRVADEFSGRGIRVIAQSDPVPGSPLVASADYDPDIIGSIKTALLQVDPSDPAFSDRIQQWDPEFAYGFIEARPEDYLQLLPENTSLLQE
ncbi:PhnD/SsuA/transferrin family substrate-binding protein [Balneolaceae bacterium ANBcel3]|nr:PhnD/SsuA/transferrin family substrate-binding protein [Balneolaceae bacterium ANBcel3]